MREVNESILLIALLFKYSPRVAKGKNTYIQVHTCIFEIKTQKSLD